VAASSAMQEKGVRVISADDDFVAHPRGW